MCHSSQLYTTKKNKQTEKKKKKKKGPHLMG